MFKPVKTRRVYEQVVEQIQGHLAAGDLKPGDKLMPERALADLLSVSRASVREALSVLEFVGILESRQGEGTFITSGHKKEFTEQLAFLVAAERRANLDILEMRKILEVAAADLAAQRANPEDLDNIHRALQLMRRDLDSDILGEDNDAAFHRSIVEATRNTMLSKTMNLTYDLVVQNMRTSRQHLFRQPGNRERLYAQHSKVFDAIQSKSGALARQAMIEHLEFVEGELLVAGLRNDHFEQGRHGK
ncbi:MAG: HTH-type transcriptional regulator LutR [Firmicutes bacterium]|nr:HTH-type transcriptional regulator LutR [Bacillota bacterium]